MSTIALDAAHVFDNANLAKYAQQAAAALQEGDTAVIIAGVNNQGAHVGIVFQPTKSGKILATGAFEHKATGENVYEGGIIARF